MISNLFLFYLEIIPIITIFLNFPKLGKLCWITYLNLGTQFSKFHRSSPNHRNVFRITGKLSQQQGSSSTFREFLRISGKLSELELLEHQGTCLNFWEIFKFQLQKHFLNFQNVLLGSLKDFPAEPSNYFPEASWESFLMFR